MPSTNAMKRIYIAIMGILFTTGECFAGGVEKGLDREECIAGAELQWRRATPIERARVVNQIADVDPTLPDYPVAGMSIRQQRLIYVIFTHSCEHKREYLADILSIYKQRIAGFPEYKLMTGGIKPSSDTIQVYGGDWADGQDPEQVFGR